jgi:hypothetical protein
MASFSSTFRWLAVSLVVSGVALSLGMVSGCSSDSTEAAPAPLGPPSFQARGLTLCTQDQSQALALATSFGGNRLPLFVDTANLTLRSKGGCFGALQCGYIQVTVDGVPSGPGSLFAASPAIDVPLDDLPTPYGSHTFLVEFRNDQGEILKNNKDEPLATSLQLTVLAPGSEGCNGKVNEPTDAGTPDDADSSTEIEAGTNGGTAP